MCAYRRDRQTVMFGLLDTRFFRVYIVPGAVFQSVMIGGGYGTGREIVEFFTSYGFLGGLFGMGIAFVCMAVILALTFEFARLFKVYDYRNFFKHLLGRGWVVFELLIILLFLLVLAVLASAAGNILRDNFGISYAAGLSIMLVVVGYDIFRARTDRQDPDLLVFRPVRGFLYLFYPGTQSQPGLWSWPYNPCADRDGGDWNKRRFVPCWG